MQPRCDEPWQEVVFADNAEGKLTVIISWSVQFQAVWAYVVYLCLIVDHRHSQDTRFGYQPSAMCPEILPSSHLYMAASQRRIDSM